MNARPQVTLEQLQRINVVGVSGGGKSTFARRLAAQLDTPHTELDRLFWEPGWQEAPDNVFRHRVKEAITPDRWLIDGNYHDRASDLIWGRATMVVWIDTPFVTMLSRSIRRAVVRVWTKQEIWPGTGNRETFRQLLFSRDSVVLWAIKTYRPIRQRYAACMADPELTGLLFVRLKNKRQVLEFLRSVDKAINDKNTTSSGQ